VPIWWQKDPLTTALFSLSSLWIVTSSPHCCRIGDMRPIPLGSWPKIAWQHASEAGAQSIHASVRGLDHPVCTRCERGDPRDLAVMAEAEDRDATGWGCEPRRSTTGAFDLGAPR